MPNAETSNQPASGSNHDLNWIQPEIRARKIGEDGNIPPDFVEQISGSIAAASGAILSLGPGDTDQHFERRVTMPSRNVNFASHVATVVRDAIDKIRDAKATKFRIAFHNIPDNGENAWADRAYFRMQYW